MPYVDGGRVVETQPWSLNRLVGWVWEIFNTIGYLYVDER